MHASNKGLFAPGNARAIRLALLAVLVLVALVTTFLISSRTFQVRNVRTLERSMSRLLGFEVSIRGPVYLQPSIRPRITLHDIHARARGKPGNDEALVVHEMFVQLNPLPLLLRHWSIVRLEVHDAEVCVSAVRGSGCDWRPALAALDQVTGIDELTIEGVKLRCVGGACGKRLEQRIAMISGNLPAHRRMALKVLAGEEHDRPLALLVADSWSTLRSDRPLEFRGALQPAAVVLAFEGVIQQPRELAGVSLEFDARGDLGRWHEVALGEMRVHGRLDQNAGGYHLRIDQGKWGTGAVNADVTATRSEGGVEVEGVLAAHHVDLDPWVDAPTQGQAAGGFADVDARFKTAGDGLGEWRKHMRGSAQVAAGPAELPIDQVERWSKGFLKFVLAFPEEGAATHVNCLGGAFDLRGETATTHELRVDTAITRMRAIGSLSLVTGEIDFLVKPQLKKGPLKDAPIVAVTGRIERPVSRIASADESAGAKPKFDQMPAEPRDPEQPCR
jgi:hypothetical protein